MRSRERTLGNKTRKYTKIKFCKAMVVPILKHGSGSWTTKRRGAKVETAETKILKRAAGYTRKDRKDILNYGRDEHFSLNNIN
jgi:hypothetical protein